MQCHALNGALVCMFCRTGPGNLRRHDATFFICNRRCSRAKQLSSASLQSVSCSRASAGLPSTCIAHGVFVANAHDLLVACTGTLPEYLNCSQGGTEAAHVQDVLRSATQLRCATMHALFVLPQLYIQTLCERRALPFVRQPSQRFSNPSAY